MGAATETRRALVLLAPLTLIYSSCAFVCPLARSSASIAPPSSLGVVVASPVTSRLLQQQHLPRQRQQCAPQPAPEDGAKEDGAGAGMGLDGDWQVVSGEVRLAGGCTCILCVLAVLTTQINVMSYRIR